MFLILSPKTATPEKELHQAPTDARAELGQHFGAVQGKSVAPASPRNTHSWQGRALLPRRRAPSLQPWQNFLLSSSSSKRAPASLNLAALRSFSLWLFHSGLDWFRSRQLRSRCYAGAEVECRAGPGERRGRGCVWAAKYKPEVCAQAQ